MTKHSIKVLPRYYEDIYHNRKPFEFRKNDRNYLPGDLVLLNEYDGKDYTGRVCAVLIKEVYCLGDLYPEFKDFVIFTFEILNKDLHYEEERKTKV